MSQEIVGPLTVTSPLGVQGGSLELGATLARPPKRPMWTFTLGWARRKTLSAPDQPAE